MTDEISLFEEWRSRSWRFFVFYRDIYTTGCKEVEISELSGIIKGKKSGNSFESFISLFGVISPALN